jgi:maleate cis-trans isomerase
MARRGRRGRLASFAGAFFGCKPRHFFRNYQGLNPKDAPDAIMLACGNWSTFDIVDRLEGDLGKPVLTTNLVSLWHALKMMGARPLDGPGVLLRQHLGDKAG